MSLLLLFQPGPLPGAIGLIPAYDLDWMQVVQNRAQPGTAIVERKALTADGMGGYTESWAAVGTVTARIYPQQRSNAEPVTGGQPIAITRWWFSAPVGTDVKPADRISASERTYEIESTNNDESWQTATRASLIAYNEEDRN